MKRSLMLTLLLTAALPLCADEPKPAGPEAAAAETATATTTPEESPLVRAARRANRLGRKPGTVITNDSVRKSKGHITTTTVQRPIDIPKPAMASDEAARVKKNELAREKARVLVIGEEKKKQQELEALERKARAAEMAEEGYFEDPDDDPARAERDADEGGRDAGENPPAANTTSGQKPPQG